MAQKRTELAEIDTTRSGRWLTPVSIRARERSIRRIRAWLRNDIWTLREACDVTFGLIPVPVLRAMLPLQWPYIADADVFFDYANRAVLAGKLTIRTRKRWGIFDVALVDPEEFGRWAASRPDLVGPERAEVLERFFPPPADQRVLSSVRQRVLASDFTTPQLEAAFGAICHFWLTDGGSSSSPTLNEVSAWLSAEFNLKPTTAIRVARVIRPGDDDSEGRD